MSDPVRYHAQGKTGVYIVKDHGDHWSCDCPAWRFRGGPVKTRPWCKHIGPFARPSNSSPDVASPPRPIARKRKMADRAMAAGKKPSVALAKEWKGQDPTGYLLSEKLDGMRCVWDGAQLLTRTGNVIHAPSSLTQSLPSMALDGELFLERGQFQQTMSIVRCHDPSKRDWSRIKYMVFDAPEVAGTASDRLSHAAIALLANPWAKIVPHRACTGGVPEVMAELQRVLALGGEGVMLKHPTNPYTGGRNSNHLKVKEFNDAEAVVVGHEPGKGKHTGRMGALLCADECGREIRIGTGFTDAQRTVPPEVGALITYKYQNKTDDGLPRFPVFMRERWPE